MRGIPHLTSLQFVLFLDCQSFLLPPFIVLFNAPALTIFLTFLPPSCVGIRVRMQTHGGNVETAQLSALMSRMEKTETALRQRSVVSNLLQHTLIE
jgi:hypothetical protein